MSLTHIETIELGSSQASITFSSIPQDYDDLIMKFAVRSTRSSSAVDNVQLFINGNESNLSFVRLMGTGSSASSQADSLGQSALVPGASATSNTFGNTSYYFANYMGANIKSVLTDSVFENNDTLAFQTLYGLSWNDTSAITSITLYLGNGSFTSNSTASLYGVTAGGDGTVTTS